MTYACFPSQTHVPVPSACIDIMVSCVTARGHIVVADILQHVLLERAQLPTTAREVAEGAAATRKKLAEARLAMNAAELVGSAYRMTRRKLNASKQGAATASKANIAQRATGE